MTSVVFAPDGTQLLTGCGDGRARIWSLRSRRVVREVGGSGGAVLDARWSGDGRWIVTGGVDATARVWEAQDGALVASFRTRGPISHVSASSSGALVAVTSAEGTEARIYRCTVCRPLRDLLRMARGVVTDRLSPEDRRLVFEP